MGSSVVSRNFVRHFQNRKRCFINDFEALTYANYLRDGTLATPGSVIPCACPLSLLVTAE
jgi:hypothetical protein